MPAHQARCDLHVHSSASLSSGEWFSRYFGCPESFVEPLRQYELCKARGMTLVTLTDHDSIEGGLQLLDKPDFFLSEEVTARFPENDCVMHVLVWGLTPAQHGEIQRRRDDIYALSRYLRVQRLAHGLAHPLLSPNWRLDAATLEKCLVLFPALETVNGTMDRRLDRDLRHLLAGSSPEVLARLALKHGLSLPGAGRRIAVTAGSDDHAARRCGAAFTEVDGVEEPRDFLDGVMAGRGRACGESSDLNALAMTVHGTAHQYFRRRGEDHRNPFLDVVERLAGRSPRVTDETPKVAAALTESLLRAAARAEAPAWAGLDLAQPPLVPSDEDDARFVAALARTSDELLGTAARDLALAGLTLDLYGLIGAAAELASALAVVAPYLFSADHLARQREQVGRVWRDWTAFAPPAAQERLAVFSDSLGQVDGVSTWCRRFELQARAAGREVWFAHCDEGAAPDRGEGLPAVARFEAPVYQGFELTVPSLVATIDRLWRQGTTHVELATPGPMGLVGLVAARLLRLPVTATYHTHLPDLIHSLTGQPDAGALARRYVGWFYQAVDRVLAPSELARQRLVAVGVPADRIGLMPFAVDPEDFRPERAEPGIFAALGIDRGARPVVLSVGRVSPEKNLPVIIDAVGRLQGSGPSPLLVIAGDGPARSELEAACAGQAHVHFVGFQQGEALRQLYASASAFVFASTVDTFGLVNLEAMASGLPVLVPAGAAIATTLVDGEEAVFFEVTADGLAEALAPVLTDRGRALRLAKNGRRHAIGRWSAGRFGQVWRALLRGQGAPEGGPLRASA